MPTSAQIPGVTFVSPEFTAAPFADDVQLALERIEERVVACETVDAMLGLIWRETALIMPHDRIGLSFVEKNGAQVIAHAARASYEDLYLRAGYTAGLGSSTLQKILETGRIRVINDLKVYLSHKPESPATRLLLREGVRSSLTVPLNVDDRRVGFLFFSSRRPDVFTTEHARILLDIVGRISQAIEKAWLIQRLADTNEGYLQMLGFVSHEMKSPLASLISRGEIYVSGYAGNVDPTAADTIRTMMRSAHYLIRMVTDYLDLARLEGGEMKFEPTDDVHLVQDVLRFAEETVSVHADQRGSTIEMDLPHGEVLLRADRDLLRIVFTNLLDNAVKYGHDHITVKLSLTVTDGAALIKVRNAGVGFSEEQKAKLFKKFSRLKQSGTEDRKGSGLGLYLTHWIVEQHGGRLTAESEAGEWAEFVVRLPSARPKI